MEAGQKVAVLLAFQEEGGPKARECMWSLEAGNGKERYNIGAASNIAVSYG